MLLIMRPGCQYLQGMASDVWGNRGRSQVSGTVEGLLEVTAI